MSEDKAASSGENRFLIDAPWFRRFVGRWVLAPWVRLVTATNKRVFLPPDQLAARPALEPAIYVTWHANVTAQLAATDRPGSFVNMTSPHPDGKMAGALTEALGASTIVAEGGFAGKSAVGGIVGFRAMLKALKDGKSLGLTGEVPPRPGREIAPGIVAVARLSGRPIVPVGIASTRHKIIERLWDRMQLNLPFGTMFIVAAPPIWIGRGDDEDEAAARIKAELDRVYAEAMAQAEAARQAPKA